MNHYSTAPDGKDQNLWHVARKRVAFKKSFVSYILVNAFLWAVWYFTSAPVARSEEFFPWPVWPTFGWGIGIAFQYAGAYMVSKNDGVEREYEKLKNKQSKL